VQILPVPYHVQISEAACGVAVFEMAYRYLRPSKLTKFSQQKIYRRLEEPTPTGTNVRVTTSSLVELARSRGLYSDWGRVSPEPASLVHQIRHFIERERVPLIACQQWHRDRTLGHFRVIVGIDDETVAFHDPERGAGGKERTLPLDQFIDAWRPTPGGNVTGGVAVWIAARQIENPLGPDAPNPWKPA
jgi:hypothetical protein